MKIRVSGSAKSRSLHVFLRYCGFGFLKRMGVNFEMQLSFDAYLLVIQTRTEIDVLIVA